MIYMTRFVFTFLFLAGLTQAQAQSLDRFVISTAAGNYTGGGLNLSWTVGQPEYITGSAGNSILTQGFQQPHKLILTARPETKTADVSVRLYPNPAHAELTAAYQFTGPGELTLTLLDATGKTVRDSQNFQAHESFFSVPIDVSDLAAGLYFVQARFTPFAATAPVSIVTKFIVQ